MKTSRDMKKTVIAGFTMTTLAILLSGCGGGGGGGLGVSSLLASTGPVSYVSAGHVVGATVYIDMDDNHAYSAGDYACAVTAADASYYCAYPAGLTHATNPHMLIAVGGVDSFTALPMRLPLLSAPQATQISPLTHLAMLQATTGLPVGPVSLTQMNAANAFMYNRMGFPASPVPLWQINSLAAGNERYLAAETAVMATIEQSVAAITTGMGFTPAFVNVTPNVQPFYGSAYNGYFNAMNVWNTPAAPIATYPTFFTPTYVQRTISNTMTAIAQTPQPVATPWLNNAGLPITPLNLTGITNMVAIAQQPILNYVNPLFTSVAQPVLPTLAYIQNQAMQSVLNTGYLNNVINVVYNSINAGTAYNALQTTYLSNLYRAAITYPSALALNAYLFQPVSPLPPPAGITPVPVTVPVPAGSWTFGGVSVAGNGTAAIAASGIAPNTLVGGTISIPAAVAPAATGLQTASMTLTPTATPGLATAMDVGFSITPTNAADPRRIAVVIKNVPVAVVAGNLVIGSLVGATMTASGTNALSTAVNATATLPAGMLTTAGSVLTLNIPALFTALTGANAGFVNLSTIKGSFSVSMAATVSSGTAPVALLETGAAILSSNSVAANVNATGQVNGQGKIVTVVLN